MLEEIFEYQLDVSVSSKTISIAKDTVIKKDGVEIARERHRRAFGPGEIEGVKEYTGWSDKSPEIVYLNSIWSAEVIAAHQALVASQEA